jgi:tripartite-type tricarboxylate transporter receptor subunit TctC
VKYIPFDSGAEMQSQLLGGHVEAIVDEPGAGAPLLEAKKIRMLVAFSEKRMTPFPEVQERAYASAFILILIILIVSVAARFFTYRFNKHVVK